MKPNLILLFLIIIIKSTCPSYGQALSICFGPTYIVDKNLVNIHPAILGKGEGGNDDWLYQISYNHYFNSGVILSSKYNSYPIATLYHFYKKNEGGSVGWVGTNVRRLDFILSYNLMRKSKFIVNPDFGFGFQKSFPNGTEIIGQDISAGIKPDFFELSKPIESHAFSKAQIVPILGLKFGYAFWDRLELIMDIQQVFGFKKIQELRMDYIYRGVKQPTAISYSDGTGRFWALGIGYRFVKQRAK